MEKISWWEHILLLFIKGHWVSTLNNGKLYLAEHKRMFGKLYVTQIEEI
jgi:hypothetical protein